MCGPQAGARLDGRRVAVGERCDIAGEVRGPALLGDGVRIGAGAVIGPATVLGADVVIDSGALVERSVLLDGARVGEGAEVRGSILAPGASVGAGRSGRRGRAFSARVRRWRRAPSLEAGARVCAAAR